VLHLHLQGVSPLLLSHQWRSTVVQICDPCLLPPNYRLPFVARGGTWSPATHHHWPAAFKAMARTLLLARSATGGGSSGGSRHKRGKGRGSDGRAKRPAPPAAGPCRLAELPADVLLLIIQLAAAPMSAWLYS
jgi:hypothetical protein